MEVDNGASEGMDCQEGNSQWTIVSKRNSKTHNAPVQTSTMKSQSNHTNHHVSSQIPNDEYPRGGIKFVIYDKNNRKLDLQTLQVLLAALPEGVDRDIISFAITTFDAETEGERLSSSSTTCKEVIRHKFPHLYNAFNCLLIASVAFSGETQANPSVK